MKQKKTLLLLTNCIPLYRIPVYTALSAHYELTVAHYGIVIDTKGAPFLQIKLHSIRRGPFTCFQENIFRLAQKYDAVLSLAELRILPFMTLSFRKRDFALCYWSIGVTVSYERKYDAVKRYDWLRTKLVGRGDSLVFYSSYPIKKHIAYGVSRKKMFVANNTVAVDEKIEIDSPKDYFLFVGTLYKAKKIFDLLESYYQASLKNKQLPDLLIVGDGDERENIIQWIEVRKLSEKIILKGAIFDSILLKEIHRKAIICISPGQAGLSVLSSMAYGVPFVTRKDAITGGEIFNIEDGVNGLYYDGSINALTELILHLSMHEEEVYKLSKNAQEYYFENRTLAVMVGGLLQAVDYAIKTKSGK